MKKLEECRAYFEDVLMDMFETYDTHTDEGKRFNALEETLTFIYGDEYKRISATWKNDAWNKFWSRKK